MTLRRVRLASAFRLGCFVLLFLSLVAVLSTKGLSAETIKSKEAVPIGGIQQWISISGTTDKPILLFLHGGPGNSMMSYADKFTRELTSHFLLVHWDQRRSGQTARLNRSNDSLTVSLFVSDAIELIRYLVTRFQQKKIYLVGHSWGGFLALKVAQAAPQLLTACIAVSPMVNQHESERLSLLWMLEQTEKSGNTRAKKDLLTIKIPFETANDLYLHRKWLAQLTGHKPPTYSFVESWANTWLPLFQEASAMDLTSSSLNYACPVYCMVGTEDYQCHVRVTENYFKLMTAPHKDLILFENIGHPLPTAAASKFQQTIVSLANKSRDR
jgi:pimeloyl-ACP methyl ester carboxylesterase